LQNNPPTVRRRSRVGAIELVWQDHKASGKKLLSNDHVVD
jgi:hypothetical protein